MLSRKMEADAIVFYDGADRILTIRETEEDICIVLEMTGELRSDVAHDILDELIAFATVGADIVVDFKNVTYIAPTTQHIFLRAQQKMDAIGKGTLTLKRLPEMIYHAFEKTGAAELLMIEN